jgi:hypothetical protein
VSRRLHELALKKQRLRFQSSLLRERWAAQAAGMQTLLAGIDRVGQGVDWVKRHPRALLAVAVAVLVARPRATLRWTRRAFIAWQAWRKGRAWLSHP